jgi:hypothetical protein
VTRPVPWISRARAHLGHIANPKAMHPADAAFALAGMLADLAELRLEVERALGRAMLELDDPGGRPKPDEPLPERREVRVALGMNRTDLAALAWLARLPDRSVASIRERVRMGPPTQVLSVRSLQKEFGA